MVSCLFLTLVSTLVLIPMARCEKDPDASSETDWSSNGGPDSKYNCEKAFCDPKYADALLPDEEISLLPGQTKLVICDGSKHGETVCKALVRPYKALSAKCNCPNNYGNFSKVGVCELEFPDNASWGLCNWPGAVPENRLILCFMNGQATDPWSLSPYDNSKQESRRK
uniref:Secreted protein n=1 Tax=Cacopsylla melanoneura TaxID=428564 RepID=A0A8D8V0K3_9HEMI